MPYFWKGSHTSHHWVRFLLCIKLPHSRILDKHLIAMSVVVRISPVLDRFVRLHVGHVATSSVKVYDVPEDYTVGRIENAFRGGHKEQLLGLLEYGIDIFAPMCIGNPEGKEHWLLDFYGANKIIDRDLLQAEKDAILKSYRKQKWKIALMGGSLAHWNGRRHFVAFLERYVINLKNTELRGRAKDIFAISIVQGTVMSYL